MRPSATGDPSHGNGPRLSDLRSKRALNAVREMSVNVQRDDRNRVAPMNGLEATAKMGVREIAPLQWIPAFDAPAVFAKKPPILRASIRGRTPNAGAGRRFCRRARRSTRCE